MASIKMVTLEYVCVYIGEAKFPQNCTSQNAISAVFLEVQTLPRVLMCD